VQRGDQWANTTRVTNSRTGNTTRVTQGSGGGTAVSNRGPGGGGTVARTGSGDVYAGRDGNVYKKSGDSWQRADGNGNWGSAGRPTNMDQLDRDSRARSEGQQRTRDYSSYQGGRSSGSSYRGGGGSYGGGGGMRGGGGGGRRR